MRLDLDSLGTITEVRTGEVWPAPRLAADVLRRAALISRHGVGPGRPVLIAHGGSASFFADLLAVWHLGGCAACVNPALTPGELEVLTGFLAPALLLVGPDFAGGEGLGVPVVSSADEKAGGGEPPEAAGGLDDPALILFTSGTTGDPKGVEHGFRSLLARTALNRRFIGDETLARTLCVLPTHFGHGLIGNCLTPLLAGGHLHLAPGTGLREAAELAAAIDDHGITFLSSVPTLWKLVLKLGKPPAGGTLRRVHVGSAPLSPEAWQRIADWAGAGEVWNMYGITETANWIAGGPLPRAGAGAGQIGPMWGGAAAVRDAKGELRRRGKGEIVVQTPSLMSGYHKRPDLTAEVLRAGWYHTGDAGRIDDDGVLWLTGRRDHVINRAGLKIHPEEIDLLLERHPAVLEACAFAVPDEISGEIVGVAARLADGADCGAEALRAWCGERIRRESVPEKWFLVDKIPRTSTGKVSRNKVRASCLKQKP